MRGASCSRLPVCVHMLITGRDVVLCERPLSCEHEASHLRGSLLFWLFPQHARNYLVIEKPEAEEAAPGVQALMFVTQVVLTQDFLDFCQLRV